MTTVNDGYATHLPITKMVVEYLNAKDIIEYGVGHNSTAYLLGVAQRLTSIELSLEWMARVEASALLHTCKWERVVCDDERLTLATIMRPCDLVFVDGGNHIHRKDIAQAFMVMQTAKAIIAHDAERMEYAYDHMYLPDPWIYVRVEDQQPWTAVMTKDETLVSLITNMAPCTVCRTARQLRDIRYPNIPSYEEKK